MLRLHAIHGILDIFLLLHLLLVERAQDANFVVFMLVEVEPVQVPVPVSQ